MPQLWKIISPILTFLIFGLSCTSEPSDSNGRNEEIPDFTIGTFQMRDSLDAIYRATDMTNHPYESMAKLAILEKMIQADGRQLGRSVDAFDYIKTLLDAGRPADAIDVLEQSFRANPELREVTQQSKIVHDMLGICHLRLGELENCLANHNDETCLFPLQGKGVHQNKAGAIGAVEVYTRILEKFPEDLQSVYLLNLSYQALGEYPEKVPKRFLIPPSSMLSDMAFPRWRNYAGELGVDGNYTSGGSIIDDFDNDGLLDIITSCWQMQGPIKFYRNKGDGTFEDRTKAAGLEKVTGGLNMVQGDYNNDGHLDFLLLRGAWKPFKAWGPEPNSLFRNNGDGTFSDVTIEAGLYQVRPTQTAVWTDFNNDGWLDLFIGNESRDEREIWMSEFYINQKDGSFQEVSRNWGIPFYAHVKGVVAGDLNNDGWQDLYISIQGGQNHLFLNDSGHRFTRMPESGLELPIFSFPCMIRDFNQDGWEDILALSYDFYGTMDQAGEYAAYLLGRPYRSEVAALYINEGNNQFKESARPYGLAQPLHGMGLNAGDINNDGYPDLYIGTGAPDYRAIVPNRMFVSAEGKRFLDVTTAGGFGNIQKGHGISFGDLDNDGDQDIYQNVGGAFSGDNFPNSLYLNPGTDNHWVSLRLRGTRSNRSAIGARVRLTVEENGHQRVIHLTCNSGGSFGCNSLQLESGLGKASAITSVEINWPDGVDHWYIYSGVKMDAIFEITEGDPLAKKVDLPVISWKLDAHSGHNHHNH